MNRIEDEYLDQTLSKNGNVFNCWNQLKNNQGADLNKKSKRANKVTDKEKIYSTPFSEYDKGGLRS